MNNLIVDIGNTAVKACRTDGMTLGKTFRYQGEKVKDFILSLIDKEKPEIMVISSPYSLSSDDEKLLSSECGKLLLLDPSHKSMLSNFNLPEYIAYDRAASILAARYLFKNRGCTVVDFGTTLTIDICNSDGSYLGGNVSLGCRTRLKALNRYSKSLPLLGSPGEEDVLGTSFTSSIHSGVVSGIMFEIEGYLESYPSNVVVFTGGDANYFAKRMKNSIFVVCNLVLMGLALIADEYSKEYK